MPPPPARPMPPPNPRHDRVRANELFEQLLARQERERQLMGLALPANLLAQRIPIAQAAQGLYAGNNRQVPNQINRPNLPKGARRG